MQPSFPFRFAVLLALVPNALAACAGSSASAGGADGAAEAAPVQVADGGIDCGTNDRACEGVYCQTGVTCNVPKAGGGCGVCACAAGAAGEWSCSAGVKDCPLTMPSATTACSLQDGLPLGGPSCFYPVDGSCTFVCNCVGDPLVQDASTWTCSNAPCGEAGAPDGGSD